MDLGLNSGAAAARPQAANAAKRQAVGASGNDRDRLMQVFAKFLLSLDMQMRGIRSILILCYSIEASTSFVTEGLLATKKWNEELQRLKEVEGKSSREAKAQLGLPNIHLWNAMIKCTLQSLEKKAERKADYDFTKAYCDELQKSGAVKELSRQVKYCRLAKMHDNSRKRLEINISETSPSYKIWMIMEKEILAIRTTEVLEGIAPPGDLNRQVHKFLEDNQPSTNR